MTLVVQHYFTLRPRQQHIVQQLSNLEVVLKIDDISSATLFHPATKTTTYCSTTLQSGSISENKLNQ